MSRNNWFTNIKFGSYAAVFYLLLSGCTLNEVYTDPNELFLTTLNQLSTSQYNIQWEEQGSIINHPPLDLTWNPLEDTERILKGASTVTIDQDLSDQQATVVIAILEDYTAKEVVIDQLHNQMSTIRSQLPVVYKSIDQQLSQAEITRMSNEITAFIDQADRKLLEWLNTSQVHLNMQIWVDRITEKPTRVQLNTTIDYMNNGQHLKESITDSFLINVVE